MKRFWNFQVLVLIALTIKSIECQSDANTWETTNEGRRHPSNKILFAIPTDSPISTSSSQSTTEIDDGPIPLEQLVSTKTSIDTMSTDDTQKPSIPVINSTTSSQESFEKTTIVDNSKDADSTKDNFHSTETYNPSTVNYASSELPEDASEDGLSETTSTFGSVVTSPINQPLVQTTSTRDESVADPLEVTTETDVRTASDVKASSDDKTTSDVRTSSDDKTTSDIETTTSDLKTTSGMITTDVKTTSDVKITTNVKTTSDVKTTTEDNWIPEVSHTTMPHSTRFRASTFHQPSSANNAATSFFTSDDDVTNNLYRTGEFQRSSTLDENHLFSTEYETTETDVTDEDSTYATGFEEESEEPLVVISEKTTTQPPQTTTMAMTTTEETTTKAATTVTEAETEPSTTPYETTPEITTPGPTTTTMEPVVNITDVISFTSGDNVTTTEAIATTERELEPYKYHEHLTNDENNNAVTVIFHVPPQQKMDVFWSIDRNHKFRGAVTHIINMEENGNLNQGNEDDLQMDEPKRDVTTWLMPDDLVYISPSPVAENRTIYVAFFIRNSSTELYTVVSADKIVDALTTNRMTMEEEMGLNVTQITKGIILVKVVRPFFVRHAIIIISLLGVAVFCILVIIITLICIRCRSSRRWERGEYDDKNKLKQDMKMNRDVGDLNSDRDIQNDEPQMMEKGGYPYHNGNGMHVISLADEGWVVPLDQPPPLPPKPHHVETEDTKL